MTDADADTPSKFDDLPDEPQLPDVHEAILDYVRENTSTDDPWTDSRHIVQDIYKQGHSRAEVKREVRIAVDRGDLFGWHGLITFPEPELLKAIIEEEREADITRKILVGKANKRIQEVEEQ